MNILEFMTVVVTTWLTFKALGISGAQGFKMLAQSDSTSALGWLRFETIFNPLNPISTVLREIIGRKMGELLLNADISLYLQHVVGLRNTIVDYLKCNVQQSNSQQLLSIFKKYGKDTPQNLRIVELPEEIFFWMLSIWEKLIQMQGLPSAKKTRLMATLRIVKLNNVCANHTCKRRKAASRSIFPNKILLFGCLILMLYRLYNTRSIQNPNKHASIRSLSIILLTDQPDSIGDDHAFLLNDFIFLIDCMLCDYTDWNCSCLWYAWYS